MIRKKTKTTKAISLGRSKKTSAIASSEEFAELDSSVSELARQTEALLGKSGEKMSKPVLPKKSTEMKRAPGHTSARSFDIIHSSDKKSNKAVLKASHPGQTVLDAPEEKLLPAEAADKSDDSPLIVSTKPKTKVLSADIVTNHIPGALKLDAVPKGAEAVELSLEEDAVKKPGDAPQSDPKEVVSKVTTVLPPDEIPKGIDDGDVAETDTTEKVDLGSASDAGLSTEVVDQKTDDAEKVPEATDATDAKPELDEDTEDEQPKAEALSSDPLTKEKTDVSQNVQIYSDNLEGDDSAKKGEDDTTEDGDDKVDIFDTEEYHSTLHDWSKLEHHNRAPVIILLLLCVVFALGVYAVVSGVKLPFGL